MARGRIMNIAYQDETGIIVEKVDDFGISIVGNILYVNDKQIVLTSETHIRIGIGEEEL